MLQLYNTLTKKKEEFKPIGEKKIRIYSCGPTVYSYAHIGNLRAYIFMDILRRVLKYNGYHLQHVMNITDVGHLTSDADEGEDKVEKAAREQNKDPYEITKMYTDVFMEDIRKLNIEKPEIIAKATEHIVEMIEYVKEILNNGYAYETSKGIYFDITKLENYGILSGKNVEEQLAGARVDVDDEKRNPLDFALWIKAPENHIMKWESPWGLSYPGWHIECSAMGRKYLGDVFDIHTGGVDHITIHHENEIAQAKGAMGKIPANIWMHGDFLLVDGGKMSKSLNNTYTISYLEEKGFEPLAYRYLCLNSHYRNKLNFTFDILESSQIALKRLREGVKQHINGESIVSDEEIKEYENRFLEAINDDLNIPKALAVLWEVVRNERKSKMFVTLIRKFDEIFALGLNEEEIDMADKKQNQNEENIITEEINSLLIERNEARKSKDWNKSDKIRDKLLDMGIKIIDTKDGTKIEKI